LTKWYVETVYTHDDSSIPRRNRYGEFEAGKVPVPELAILALVSTGWGRENAESVIKGEADLDGTTIEDGGFGFNFWDNNGQFDVTVSREPIPKAAAYVVMVNGQPVAVRPWEPREDDMAAIAGRLKLPISAFSVFKVEDVLG
jgi:hypothetical protein